jgi:DNA modification methylase
MSHRSSRTTSKRNTARSCLEVGPPRVHRRLRPPRREVGDARDLSFLRLKPGSVDLIVTSPPYWRRRDYEHDDQLGQEPEPDAYVDGLVAILNGWADLLCPHGSVFLNLGDTYLNGFLAGIPARFEVAVRRAGWNVVNHITWTKSIGLPEPRPFRLASRHEPVFHLTRAKNARDLYVDLFALAQELGQAANPGDAWEIPWPDDVWPLHPARSRTDHIAPFPPELVQRAILFACPERVCTACGLPQRRRLEPTTDLDPSRRQAVQAMRLAKQHGLTEAHFAAIRAVGISDAGKGRRLQHGAKRNDRHMQALAAEAKSKLGGYFREFTFAPKRHVGWEGCACIAPTRPGVVLDPFMGSGTTLLVARRLRRDAIGVDLVVPEEMKSVH